MGIVGDSLIKLCTLLAWACDFSDVLPSTAAPEGETPTAVIDGNCWVYECACGICSGLTTESGYASFDAFVHAYKKRLAYVRKCGWSVIIVFDGRRLPLKRATHLKREAARKKAKAKAAKTKIGSGLSTFHPTHELIHRLVLSLREASYDTIVAPHEGDPQCVFFCQHRQGTSRHH